MFDVINATVCGRLTSDAIEGKSKSGKSYVAFSIAVNTGKEEVTYISVIAYGTFAENLPDLAKGERVTCIGELKMAQGKKEGDKPTLRLTLSRIFTGIAHPSRQKDGEEDGIPSYQSEEEATGEYY